MNHYHKATNWNLQCMIPSGRHYLCTNVNKLWCQSTGRVRWSDKNLIKKTTTKNEITYDEKIDKQTEKIFSWTSEVRLTVESDIQQHLSLCRVMRISCQKSVARKYCLHLKTINEISTVSVVKLFLSLLHDLKGSYNLNCIISAVSCFFFFLA